MEDGVTQYTHGSQSRERVSRTPVALIYERGSMSFDEACKAHLYGKKVLARRGDWAVTDFGLECLATPYWIEVKRLWGLFWLRHMQEKAWVVYEDFCTALEEARQIHRAASNPTKRRRGSARPALSTRLRFVVLKRDGYACQLCGATATAGAVLHIDHKVARAKGGTDDLSNLWTLCFECNLGKRTDDL